jgi:thiol-disulfide isomerase/thioredoxin
MIASFSRIARMLSAFVVLGLASVLPLPAQEANPGAESSPGIGSPETNAALQGIVEGISAKAEAGKTAAADYQEEMDALEALYQKVKAAGDENLALVLAVRASVHLQLLDDPAAALKDFALIREGLPKGHEMLEAVERMEGNVKEEIQRREKVSKLVGSQAPELNFVWSSREGLKRLSELRGKVVILDFWATWCGPCVATFPKLRELVAHYEGKPVEVVGVTSIQGAIVGLEAQPIRTKDDPEREKELLEKYVAAKEMNWTVVVSEQDVFNPDYGVEGIPHVVIIAPDGTIRHSGIHPGIPLAQKAALIDPILAEFAGN